MPVHAAACWAQPDLIELLCEYGGDINAKTNNGETPLDLCEDSTTRAVIVTVQQQEARKKRLAFGVRDSRRQSRKRKKFESPQQPTANTDNPFSARGAIRRLSLRDRSGMTLARLEGEGLLGFVLQNTGAATLLDLPRYLDGSNFLFGQ
ncbi:unnamed protein product [Toxocara canis]|uniref:ANK_REP_REGION domain-containing protein n=1 Tax=Toxocara canis TaxID=6265 RepID=A0A183U8B0_TOXCA|nr:unnamed protein product [Toxocara canis]